METVRPSLMGLFRNFFSADIGICAWVALSRPPYAVIVSIICFDVLNSVNMYANLFFSPLSYIVFIWTSGNVEMQIDIQSTNMRTACPLQWRESDAYRSRHPTKKGQSVSTSKWGKNEKKTVKLSMSWCLLIALLPLQNRKSYKYTQ